jgi:hypothetical protein
MTVETFLEKFKLFANAPDAVKKTLELALGLVAVQSSYRNHHEYN